MHLDGSKWGTFEIPLRGFKTAALKVGVAQCPAFRLAAFASYFQSFGGSGMPARGTRFPRVPVP